VIVNRLLVLAALLALAATAGNAADGKLAPGMGNPGYHEPPPWFKQSFLILREEVAEAARAARDALLLPGLYQDGCPYCLKTLRDNLGQKVLAEKTQKHFDVIAVNTWGDREVVDLLGKAAPEKEFSKSQRIQFTPTLLMLDEAGKVVLGLNGHTPPAKFEAAIDFVGGRLEKQGEFADYLQKHVRIPASGKLHTEPWMLRPPLNLADRLKTGNRPLLVLFEQKECRECDELHAESFRRREVAERLGSFQVAQVTPDRARPYRRPAATPCPARTGRAA
jgi:thioredoxin-related protein